MSAWGSLTQCLKCPTSHDWSGENIDWTATECETWKKYRCTRICRECRTVNDWWKNILSRIFCQPSSVLLLGSTCLLLMSARASQASCCSSNSGRSYSKTANALVTSLDLSGLVWNLMVAVKSVIVFSTHSSFSKYVLHHSIITFVQSNWYRMVFQDLQGGCEVEGMFLFGPF